MATTSETTKFVLVGVGATLVGIVIGAVGGLVTGGLSGAALMAKLVADKDPKTLQLIAKIQKDDDMQIHAPAVKQLVSGKI